MRRGQWAVALVLMLVVCALLIVGIVLGLDYLDIVALIVLIATMIFVMVVRTRNQNSDAHDHR